MKPIDRSRAAHWAADLIEVAAVFFAVGAAHLFVTLLGERAHGEAMLVASAGILIAGALLRQRWTRRRPAVHRHTAMPDLLAIPAAGRELMRLRTTLPDRPGTLAALSGGLAALGVNILAIQIHPAEHGAVDELLIAVPRGLTPATLTTTVEAAGGELTEVTPADVHDLVDPATRALTVAHRAPTAEDAVRSLLSADLTTTPPPSPFPSAALHDAAGHPRYLTRHSPAFTATEVSRAQALINLCEGLSRTRRET
ncbi:ACT domain-containing protein [Actinoplanes sp. NPDC049596]|uniref:ACT domain-containing protein n=1 Tax=unclassified Actinoplanes TaxID=2626549 RepID=UPI003447AE78